MDQCIALIAADPQLLAEAAGAVPALRQAALVPAGDEGVRRVVGRRLATFPAMEMSDGEWAAWWGDYVGALGDLSEAALELGMRAYIREPKAEFMPKPGRLREMARGCVTTASAMYARAKASVDALQRRTAPPRQRPDPAAIAEIVGSLRSRTTLNKPVSANGRPMPPPVSAEVGESGVSAELRAQQGLC